MKEWVFFLTEKAVIVIDAMALIVIVVGTFEAFIRASAGSSGCVSRAG